MTAAAITFPRRGAEEFIRDIKARVTGHFTTTGQSTKADWTMWLKTVLLLTMVFGSYAAIMTNRFSPWEMLGFCFIMGIGVAGDRLRDIA